MSRCVCVVGVSGLCVRPMCIIRRSRARLSLKKHCPFPDHTKYGSGYVCKCFLGGIFAAAVAVLLAAVLPVKQCIHLRVDRCRLVIVLRETAAATPMIPFVSFSSTALLRFASMSRQAYTPKPWSRTASLIVRWVLTVSPPSPRIHPLSPPRAPDLS